MILAQASDESANFSLHREHFNVPVIARFTVDGEPVSKARARFTNQGSKTRAFTPEKTFQAEQAVAWKFRQAARGHKLDTEVAYGVVALFFSSTRQRRDIDNMLKLILDGLNKVAWPDDAQVVEISGRKEHCPPEDARTEVVVYSVGRVYRPTGTCEQCGQEFPSYRSQAARRFCSNECHVQWRYARRRRACEHCGTEFDGGRPGEAAAKYCSVTCKSNARRATVKCTYCDVEFTKQRCHVRKHNYCSTDCSSKARRESRRSAAKGTCESCGGPTTKKSYRRCAGCTASVAGRPQVAATTTEVPS